jgi:hypothetical protein
MCRCVLIPPQWSGRRRGRPKRPRPDKVGFIYMLNGDNGASNTDPWATKSEPNNHWIKTGAHVMIVGPSAKTMAEYPRTENPDPTKPYVMWAGSPYEHLMLPTCAKPGT